MLEWGFCETIPFLSFWRVCFCGSGGWTLGVEEGWRVCVCVTVRVVEGVGVEGCTYGRGG